ncbi:hypothetical protein SLNSH_09750 [Alsobacter soli]|uniref:Uncharacterized protein n=1 Tax=Alsobacter soli TaxID=2109933 RepID=A0A2T1HTX7_9HYPH|nr:hypothetical protein [Alsobacter soli]PSC05102.1 hypothetical protein SLNSH_09750 [Alsobacter soli]
MATISLPLPFVGPRTTRKSGSHPFAELFRVVAEAGVEARRAKAVRELRKHQAFGPLVGVKYVGLTTEELLPFIRQD